MSSDLTVALFSGPELGGGGPARFMRRSGADIVVGHGLGDLAALAAAQVIGQADAVELARVREQLVARANAEQAGGLLCVVDHAAGDAARHIAILSGARVARHDSPGRVVLAGSHEQLMYARIAAHGLAVSVVGVSGAAALHTPAMAGAASAFADAVAGVAFRDATRIVYSAVTAAPMRDPRAELVASLRMPVLWRQTVCALSAAGAARFVEADGRHALGDLVLETLSASERAAEPAELQHAGRPAR
jgi:[acyl-carrier-protein] S-malonyltransferase